EGHDDAKAGFAHDVAATPAQRFNKDSDSPRADRRASGEALMAIVDRPDIEHSATELLEVERLTTALSADWLEQYGVLPLRLDGDVLAVGTWLDRVEPLALDDLRLLFGARVVLERFSDHDLRTAIRRIYSPEAATAEG